MAMFYFHIRRGRVLLEDPDGSQLPDLAAAIVEARASARTLIAELVENGGPINPDSIVVADEDGSLLAEVNFHDVVVDLLRH